MNIESIATNLSIGGSTQEIKFLNTVLELPKLSGITEWCLRKTLHDIDFWERNYNQGLNYFESQEEWGLCVFDSKIREKIISAINSFPEIEKHGRT